MHFHSVITIDWCDIVKTYKFIVKICAGNIVCLQFMLDHDHHQLHHHQQQQVHYQHYHQVLKHHSMRVAFILH